MEYYGKNPKPYKGIGFFVVFLVLPPILIFALVYTRFTEYNDAPQDVVISFSLLLSCIIGTLINLISIFRGLIEDLLRLSRERLKEFFDEVTITPKGAFKSYFFSFYHDGGIILVIFFTYMIALIVIGILGFINVYNWVQSLDLKL